MVVLELALQGDSRHEVLWSGGVSAWAAKFRSATEDRLARARPLLVATWDVAMALAVGASKGGKTTRGLTHPRLGKGLEFELALKGLAVRRQGPAAAVGGQERGEGGLGRGGVQAGGEVGPGGGAHLGGSDGAGGRDVAGKDRGWMKWLRVGEGCGS